MKCFYTFTQVDFQMLYNLSETKVILLNSFFSVHFPPGISLFRSNSVSSHINTLDDDVCSSLIGGAC